MNIRTRLPVTMAVLLVCYASGITQDMQSDFDRTREKRTHVRVLVLSDFHEAAKAFVAQHHTTETIDFLVREAQKPANRKFALLCLAELSMVMPAAQEALLEQASRPQGKEVVLVASYLPMDQTYILLRRLLTQPITPPTEESALELLGAIGDQDIAQWLRERKSTRSQAALEAAIQEIDQRTQEVAPERIRQRVLQERLYWRVMEETALPYRSSLIHDKLAAEAVQRQQERFTPEFLRDKLQKKDPLAVRLVGIQGEGWAIGSLRDLATDTGDMGMRARGALGQIGSRQALSVLEELLHPEQAQRTLNQIGMGVSP